MLVVGEAKLFVREKVDLIEAQTHMTISQYVDEEIKDIMTHVNTFNCVLTELASKQLNFDEEVKYLELTSSSPRS